MATIGYAIIVLYFTEVIGIGLWYRRLTARNLFKKQMQIVIIKRII